MSDVSTTQRHAPARACERMIRLVADALQNARSRQLRTELTKLQDNLAPAARELDKWVLAYRTYGSEPGQNAAGLARLHNEILQGDQEIGDYLIRTVHQYVDWCLEQVQRCVDCRSHSTRALQEGFLREDLRKMNRLAEQLTALFTANVKNKKWIDSDRSLKRKHMEATSKGSSLRVKLAENSQAETSRQFQTIDSHDSDGPHTSIKPVSRAYSLTARDQYTQHLWEEYDQAPGQAIDKAVQEQHKTYNPQQAQRLTAKDDVDQGIRHRKRAKRDRVLPVDPELASHVALSILRAVGRHPELPPLNAGLADLLPKKLRAADIPYGESLATVQNAMVQEAQQWWKAKAGE